MHSPTPAPSRRAPRAVTVGRDVPPRERDKARRATAVDRDSSLYGFGMAHSSARSPSGPPTFQRIRVQQFPRQRTLRRIPEHQPCLDPAHRSAGNVSGSAVTSTETALREHQLSRTPAGTSSLARNTSEHWRDSTRSAFGSGAASLTGLKTCARTNAPPRRSDELSPQGHGRNRHSHHRPGRLLHQPCTAYPRAKPADSPHRASRPVDHGQPQQNSAKTVREVSRKTTFGGSVPSAMRPCATTLTRCGRDGPARRWQFVQTQFTTHLVRPHDATAPPRRTAPHSPAIPRSRRRWCRTARTRPVSKVE